MNDLTRDKLKETVNLQDIIKTDNLRNKSKSFADCFFRDMHEGHISLKDADDGQSIFAEKLKNLAKSRKTTEEVFFF